MNEIETRFQLLREYIAENGRTPAKTYERTESEKELNALRAIKYIRKMGSEQDRALLKKLLRGRNYEMTFDEFMGKLRSFIERHGHAPKIDGRTYIERKLCNRMYKVNSGDRPDEKRRLLRYLSKNGIEIRSMRSTEEVFQDLESFMKSRHRFPLPKPWESNEHNRENNLYQFACRIARNKTKGYYERLQELVVKYDLMNTCTIFIEQNEK